MLPVVTTIHHSSVQIHHDSQVEQDNCLKMVDENTNSLDQDNSQTSLPKLHFLIPRCFACKGEMQFIEGDIIYGDKWYHHSCWKDTEKIELVSH
jgi:hypothetical protein